MAQSGKKSVDNEVLALLKVDNKGWNIALFVDTIKASTCLCENCKSVCCDATELGCDHDDDDIYAFCKQCLIDLIKLNNNKCMISSHIDPPLISARSTRRQISKSLVICPFSHQYKTRKNDIKNNDNRQVIDTIGNYNNNGDEKEGNQQNIAAAADPHKLYSKNDEFEDKGCEWKGTLNDLINKHITKCAEQHDPTFVLKIKIKKLQTQNAALNIQIGTLQNEMEQEKLKNNEKEKELNQQIGTLQKEINNKEITIKTDLIKIDEQNKLIQEQSTETKQIQDLYNKIKEEYTRKQTELNEQIITLKKEINGKELQIQQFENELNDKIKIIKNKSDKIDEQKQLNMKLQNENNTLQNKRKEENNLIQQQSVKMKQIKDEYTQKQTQLNQQIIILKEKINGKELQIEQFKNEKKKIIKKLDQQQNENNTLKHRTKELESQLNEQYVIIQKSMKNAAEKQQDIDQLTAKLKVAESSKICQNCSKLQNDEVDQGNMDDDEDECCVCYEPPRNHMIIPCNHICLCPECAEENFPAPHYGQKCPLCSKDVQDVKLYIPKMNNNDNDNNEDDNKYEVEVDIPATYYTQWTTEHILKWISRIENGFYTQKYGKELRRSLYNYGVNGGDLALIKRDTLRKWGITSTYNQVSLMRHIESLVVNNKQEVDESKFLQWKEEDIMVWIVVLLGKGRFFKYRKNLDKTLKHNIDVEKLKKINHESWERYGITDKSDRCYLSNMIAVLATQHISAGPVYNNNINNNNNNNNNNDVEGYAITQYI